MAERKTAQQPSTRKQDVDEQQGPKTQPATGGLKLSDVQTELREVAPVGEVPGVRLTSPTGTAVTVPQRMADGMKAAGFKPAKS